MLSQILVTAVIIAATVMLFAIAGRIVRTALRTGRWLGQGVVYDRAATPIRFRLALGSTMVLLAVMTFASALLSYGLFAELTR